MSEPLTEEHKVIFARHSVGKHFVCLSSVCEVAARRTDFNVCYFVRIGDLSDGRFLITVPEEDGRALSSSYEFELMVFALSHAVINSISSLSPVDSLFSF